MTITTFFATRTLARNAAQELNGKVKDFGTSAQQGERWGVLVEVPEVLESAQVVQTRKVLSIPAAHVSSTSVGRTCTLNNKYKKPVQVTTKRKAADAKASWMKVYNAA